LIALVIPKRHSALGQDFPHPTNSTAAIVVSRRCFITDKSKILITNDLIFKRFFGHTFSYTFSLFFAKNSKT
jgi:hypothetical protein